MTEPNTHTPDPHAAGPITQGQRRLRYGLNVVVAVLAALALAVMVNWLVDSQIESMPPAWRSWVRYDLTSTRQHSLSDQTISVLKGLDKDYQIVTLLRARQQDDPAELDRARDLVDEYARRSSRVEVEHINPSLDVGRLDRFYNRLRSRYDDQLAPMRDAVAAAGTTLKALKDATAGQIEPLRAILSDPDLKDEELKQFIMLLAQRMTRLGPEIDQLEENIKAEIDLGPLPFYTRGRDEYVQFLVGLDRKLYAVAIERMERAARTSTMPGSVRNGLLTALDPMAAARKIIEQALPAIEKAQAVESYDKLSVLLAGRDNSVVLMGPDSVRVLSVAEMFRATIAKESGASERAFLGEEKITGALIAMGLKTMPMVVFVHNQARSMLAPGTGYSDAARRLTNLDFRVEEWSPVGKPGPMGQPTTPAPPPEPAPGQKAVWILLPLEPPNPMNPMSRTADQALKVITERLNKGDNALVFTTLSSASRFGPTDPILLFLEPWSIKPSLDRLILRQVQVETRQTLASNLIRISEWSDALPISKAVRGMAGVVWTASPLELLPTEGKSVKTYPLVYARSPEMWAEREISKFPNLKFDPANASDSFLVAAAAESEEGGRLIVISDPMWANDMVITNADPMLQRGEGMAEYYGAAYPGNAELFINSVYWLSGLDRLIAAGARSQDIRRVGELTRGGRSALLLLLTLGLPCLCAISGVGVWLVRRRS